MKELVMTTSNIVWLVVAVVVAVLLLATLVIVTRRRRHLKAEGIRQEARVETSRVERREALAEETAAKARAAQAEAEVKAAEAARLQQRAASHQSEAASSREDLDERWKHADSIDPKAKARQDAARHEDGRSGESRDAAYDRAAEADAASSTGAPPPDLSRE
jgi:FtsZ-interacting cell division protein ZipA